MQDTIIMNTEHYNRVLPQHKTCIYKKVDTCSSIHVKCMYSLARCTTLLLFTCLSKACIYAFHSHDLSIGYLHQTKKKKKKKSFSFAQTMDYIKTIVPKNKFNIYEFYKHIDADDREEAEDNFKSLIKQLLLLPDNPEDKLTKRLKQFAKKVKKYKYRVMKRKLNCNDLNLTLVYLGLG